MEWDLLEPEIIQLNLVQQQDMIEEYPKWHVKWSMLMDPVGKGLSEVLEATVQHALNTKKETRRVMKAIPLDPFHMETGYTVLSAELSKQMDREERAYQKVSQLNLWTGLDLKLIHPNFGCNSRHWKIPSRS